MARNSALKNPEPAAKIGGNRYFALDGEGNVVPAGDHKAVRIENDLLARPLIVSAYRCGGGEAVPWKKAAKVAEAHDAYGWSWRLPTVEEAFFIPERANYPALPKEFFPDFEGWEWIWTSTVDAASPSVYAWGVNLDDGFSSRARQSFHYHVRAVRAGQF